jgi:DNA helicase-2/ATP-dependent DNA helicase PcrA
MDLSQLNPAQRAAVTCTEGPLLVLAGAGSGKTRVITHRIAHLLELGVPPERIVALSFTNKAAGEMRERLAAMVGARVAGELVLGTFHSLGARMLRSEPAPFGLDAGRFVILDQGDVLGLVRQLMRELGHHGYDERRFDVAGIAQRIGLRKNELVAPEPRRPVRRRAAATDAGDYDAIAASVHPAYEERLRSLGAVDFDDLVCIPARTLRDDARVRARWQGRFDYVLVDEYQDTNLAQLVLLQGLVAPPHNLCVVGDDDQAIYGWRGAKVENILRFDRLFSRVTVVKLEHNYRSRAPILAVANRVIGENIGRHAKALRATRRGGDPVMLVIAPDSAQEAAWVGRQVRRLVVEERVGAGEVAVLYRSAVQARAIEEQLKLHGLRWRVLGGQSVYDKKEVKDALAWLRTVVTPRDELAVRRALETPPRGIGRQTLEAMRRWAQTHGRSLVDAAVHADEIDDLGARAAAPLRRFGALVREAQAKVRSDGARAALEHVLESIALREHVRKETGSDAATEQRMAGVQWLLDSLARWEERQRAQNRKPRWSDWLGSVALDSNETDAPDPAQDAAVTLATLHSAKGLEWSCVFLVGLEEGTMPHRRVDAPRASDAIAGDLEEERRLFYVGITRARDRLWITRAEGRLDRGREIARAPSRFLADLPADAVRTYAIAREEELSPRAIGDMADAFLASIRPRE